MNFSGVEKETCNTAEQDGLRKEKALHIVKAANGISGRRMAVKAIFQSL